MSAFHKRHCVLVVGAHPDDEVLGCGGTLARLAQDGCEIHLLVLADGETSRGGISEPPVDPQRIAQRESAARSAAGILGCASVKLLSLPDNRMDSLDLLEVVRHIEDSVNATKPATVITHHAGDVNIDHRIVHDAVIAACRPVPGHCVRRLLFFEVPSSTEWRPPSSAAAFNPNWFVDISATIAIKMKALEAYRSEMRRFPHPRSLEAMHALAQWRGASIGVAAAEAYILGRELV
jgi:N-acetylglucosamine malate deacetylase 1